MKLCVPCVLRTAWLSWRPSITPASNPEPTVPLAITKSASPGSPNHTGRHSWCEKSQSWQPMTETDPCFASISRAFAQSTWSKTTIEHHVARAARPFVTIFATLYTLLNIKLWTLIGQSYNFDKIWNLWGLLGQTIPRLSTLRTCLKQMRKQKTISVINDTFSS